MKGYLVDKCPHCGHWLRRRSEEQNKKLHAVLQDISEQLKWHGRYYDAEDWKRLLTAGFVRAQGEQVRAIPAVDGKGLEVLYRKTSFFSRQEMTDFLEYLTSWAIEQGVKLED